MTYTMPANLRCLTAAYLGLGDIHHMKGNCSTALSCYRRAASVIPCNTLPHIRARRKIAEVYQTLGKYTSAIAAVRRTERKLKVRSFQGQIEKCELLLTKCWLNNVQGNVTRAIQVGRSCVKAINRLAKTFPGTTGLQMLKARAFNTLGTVYYQQGNYSRAQSLFEQNLEATTRLGDKQSIAEVAANLGSTYAMEGNYDAAIRSFRESLRVATEIGDKQVMGLAAGPLGTAYYYKRKYETALAYMNMQVEICTEIGDRRGIGSALCNMGGVLLARMQFTPARRSLERAEKILAAIGDRYTLIDVYVNMAWLHSQKNTGCTRVSKQALRYSKKALRLAQRMDFRARIAYCYRLYARIYESVGDAGTAALYTKKAEKVTA